MKKVITLSGTITYGYSFDNWNSLKLKQEDGYLIDLISRFNEIVNSFGKTMDIKYYLAHQLTTKEEIKENWLKSIFGDVTAEYQSNEYNYSEYTQGVDYDSELMISGHNLHNELRLHEGKYIILEIQINTKLTESN